jgi:hypothetical protein
MSFIQGIGSTDPTNATNTPSLRPFANLNLTDDQASQIRTILQTAQAQGTSPTDVQTQINAVLNPQQHQTLQNDLAAQKTGGHHHGGHHHHSSSSATSTSATTAAPANPEDPTIVPLDPTLTNGVSATDLQNQSSAATSIAAQQLQNALLNNGSSTS